MKEIKAFKCEDCGRISENMYEIFECEKNKPFQYAKSGDICKIKALGMDQDAIFIIRFKEVRKYGHDFHYTTEDIFKYKTNWFEGDSISHNYDFERLFLELELIGNENEGFNVKEYIKTVI